MAAEDIVALSRERIRHGSKSFAGAARLFRGDIRDHSYMLYAWCRHCDDVIDDQVLGFRDPAQPITVDPALAQERAAVEIAKLRAATERAIAGQVASDDDSVFHALARVVAERNIPGRFPLDHLAGFQMDVDDRAYDTIEDVLEYSYHVAGVVGVMMAMVMGVEADDTDTLDRASDLGIAFQLTNIARDVMDDIAIGRVYLPASWLREAGVDPSKVGEPASRDAVHSVALRLLDLADAYYASAEQGIARLSPRSKRSAWAIAAAKNVYRDIGSVIRGRGAAAWDERAVVGRRRKLWHMLRAGLEAPRGVYWPAPAERPRTGLWSAPSLRVQPLRSRQLTV